MSILFNKFSALICLFFFFAYNSSAIKVLTYNICWECMSGTSTEGSAKELGAKCVLDIKKKRTYCAENIGDEIDRIYDHYNSAKYENGEIEPWDFIGLQEAKDYKTLINTSSSLKELKSAARSGLATFYNPKYTLKKEIYGKVSAGGRPVQILIFSPDTIFINVHAGHNPTQRDLENNIGKTLKANMRSSEISKLKEHRLIVVGDFNDHDGILWANQKKGMPFRPLNSAGISTPVYLPAAPPKTCCKMDIPYPITRVKSPGDYIFDSVRNADFKFKVPTFYDKNTPKSDHLPVIYVGDN